MFGLGGSSSLMVKRIKDAAQKELSGVDEQLLAKLWDWIGIVFQKWKLEHGDRNPEKHGLGCLS
ncbi:MAG: hypothetical protein A3B82_02675 [Methylophilales bacterium RIFCSPHIGHO2_02_FULL_57_10]|nr:MAG: hypothetical protein A3B82_02675 [Methylophilales bacterium RIFCSPHIGHO2_02_FULL_57_10]